MSMIESEAEDSGDEADQTRTGSPRNEESNVPEGPDGYEEDGFVVTQPTEEGIDDGDDDDDDDEAEDDSEELDSDEYALIQENTGTVVKRKSEKKLKRLRKKRKTVDTGPEVPTGDDHIRVSKQGAQGKLAEELFGEDGEDAPTDSKGPEDINFDNEGREDDELDDFIEYDGPRDGPPQRRPAHEDEAPAKGVLNAEEQELLAAVFGQQAPAFTFSDDDDDDEDDDEEAPDTEEGIAQKKDPAAKLVIEPAEIKAHFLEERDEIIRGRDMPERLQLWHSQGEPQIAAGVSLEDEAEWVCNQYLRKMERYRATFERNKDHYQESIQNILKFILEDHLEVPFINEYRKDHWANKPSGLSQDDAMRDEDWDSDRDDPMRDQPLTSAELWKVMDWHDCWIKFIDKRQALSNVNQDAEAPSIDSNRVALISTVTELDDWFAYYARQQPVEAGPRRRPVTRRLYMACKAHGVDQLAQRIGLSAADFGDNLDRGYSRHQPTTESLSPEDTSEAFIVEGDFLFGTKDKVLNSAKKMLAQDIGSHPLVRKYFRDVLTEERQIDERRDMLFTTKATRDGLRVVQEHHQYFRVRQLQDMPAHCFKDHDYILLMKAQKEQMITVEVSFSQEATQSLKAKMADLFGLKLGGAEMIDVDDKMIEKAWNEIREGVLGEAINQWLLPAYMRDCRKQLQGDAQNSVIASCVAALKVRALSGKYCPPEEDLHRDTEVPDAFTIMACCHSDDKEEETCIVVLDENLEVKDQLLLGDNRRNDNYTSSIQAFIEKNKPHVITIGTSTMMAVDLQEDLLNVVQLLEQQDRCPEGFRRIHVCFHDDDMASIFRQSPRAVTEFGRNHRYKPLALQAIALGRHLADPMTEVCEVAKDPDELLCLQLHDLQTDVHRTELLKELERALVDVVNEVGVDFNLIMRTNFRVGPLQYVAGLGPRKALALRRGVTLSGGVLSQRNELIQKNLMGMKVFENCVGFLKIFARRDQDVLDATRIHPEVYDIAQSLARTALRNEDDEEENDDDPNELVETIMLDENKYLLDDLPERDWAEHFEKQGRGPMYHTVASIFSELKRPYNERREYQPLPWSATFQLLTGETLECENKSKRTLYNGALVEVSVMSIQPRGLMCMTESGVKGYLRIEEFSDNYDRDEAEANMGAAEYSLDAHVKRRQVIRGRVIEIQCENAFPLYDHRSNSYRRKTPLNLSCRGQVLRDPTQDPFSDYVPHKWFRPKDDADVEKAPARPISARPVVSHQINHPHFKNETKVGALELLEKEPAGSFIIRPSSRGRDHLNITWKFADDIPCIHIDVKQEGLSDSVTVGSAFVVGDDRFEDLDELIASYLEPRIDKVSEVIAFRKFFNGAESEVEGRLKKEKEHTKIPYCIFASREKIGRFVLAYYGKKMMKEYIMVRSDGLWYRKQCFDKPNDVMTYFKKNYNKPIPK
jgi:transcription elongation factor SPT6